MRIAIEGLVSVFFVTILLWVSTGLINAQLEINQAQDFHSNAVINIKNSNYDNDYIEEYIELAESLGYELEVVVIRTDKIRCVTCGCNQLHTCFAYNTTGDDSTTLTLNDREYVVDDVWRSYDYTNTLIEGSESSLSYTTCPACSSQIVTYTGSYVGQVDLTYSIEIPTLNIDVTATKTTAF